MYEPTQDAVWAHSIDLAREADFDLGSLRVRPARCEVEWDGVAQTLQRRVMQVLVALSHARGSVVSQDDLVIRCWRGLSVSDDAIYRCISKLRKLAADYPHAFYAIEAIPGVGYRLTSPSLGGDDLGVVSAAPREDHFRYRAMVAAAALFVLITAGAGFWMFQGRAPDPPPLSVSVLPFETLSDSGEARSLARRIPNEVVDSLGDSQIETVLAGEQARSASAPPGLVVRGMLRDDGRNLFADVRIEDGASRAALWSTEFRRESRDASDLPLEVAARVADIVNMINFARSADPPLTDDSALTALLQTMDMIRDTSDGAWAPMLQKAQGVVARHPEFAFGHSHLAYAYAEAADSISVPDQAQAMREAAQREANLTLKLDPQDAGAYAVLWAIEPRYNYQAQEAILLRGIKYARHPKEPLGALYSYEGTMLSSVGRLREALSFQLVARATDEWGPPKTAKLALTYASVGNLAAARSWVRQAIQRWPNHSAVRAARLNIAAFYEQPADALAIFDGIDEGAPANENQTRVWRLYIQAKEARSRRVTGAAIQKIREAAANGEIPHETEIMMLAGLGETTQAIAAANLTLDREKLDARFLFTPVMRDVRRDPGFVGLASRMGLVRYWRETGKRPDFCAGRTPARECSPQLLAALKT